MVCSIYTKPNQAAVERMETEGSSTVCRTYRLDHLSCRHATRPISVLVGVSGCPRLAVVRSVEQEHLRHLACSDRLPDPLRGQRRGRQHLSKRKVQAGNRVYSREGLLVRQKVSSAAKTSTEGGGPVRQM